MNRRMIPAVAAVAFCLAITAINPRALLPRAGLEMVSAAHAQATVQPLSANDVSWLFPAPTQEADLKQLISIGSLTASDPKDPKKRNPVWSEEAFHQFLTIAAGPAGRVAGTAQRIGLPAEVWSENDWYIAGVRIDPAAPGASDKIRDQLGRELQIRLVVQPVTADANGGLKVHDLAAHLVFTFKAGNDDPPALAGCLSRPHPDLVRTNTIVSELDTLRTKLSKVADTTSGKPLGVHPGLLDPDPITASYVSGEMKSFLERHVSGEHLELMAIAALAAESIKNDQINRWIFLSMGPSPSEPDGGFVAYPGAALDGQQYAQMFEPGALQNRVIPVPHPNNLNPVTCLNAALPTAGPPIERRQGYSTAELFASRQAPDQRQPIEVIEKNLNVIADPSMSHFLNTDCVSCHTETGRRMDLGLAGDLKGIDATCQPAGPGPGCTWNLRNFGWSPVQGKVVATVTQRTIKETEAVVNFINASLLAGNISGAAPAKDTPLTPVTDK